MEGRRRDGRGHRGASKRAETRPPGRFVRYVEHTSFWISLGCTVVTNSHRQPGVVHDKNGWRMEHANPNTIPPGNPYHGSKIVCLLRHDTLCTPFIYSISQIELIFY